MIDGSKIIFLLFTLAFNLFLYLGFSKKALFFDTFLSIYLWLGFWFKYVYKLLFSSVPYGWDLHTTGNFDFTIQSFDNVLTISTIAIFGFIFSILIRRKFFNFEYTHYSIPQYKNLFYIYKNNRVLVLSLLIIFILYITSTNFLFGFYQKGLVNFFELNFLTHGFYKWLLLFGLTSLVITTIHFELFHKKNNFYIPIFLLIFEGFLSNLSLLSRYLVLSLSVVFFGLYKHIKIFHAHISLRLIILCIFLIFSFSMLNIFLVNNYRYTIYHEDNRSTKIADRVGKIVDNSSNPDLEITFLDKIKPLLVNRWVGMEAVMAVSSYDLLGWNLFLQSTKDNKQKYNVSFYDDTFINSPYSDRDKDKYNFNTSPGIIAFLFYSGSYLFLFFGTFIIGKFGSLFEIYLYKYGGKNIILSALFANLLAYRWASFGYAPHQTYLLVGTIILNIAIFYYADKFSTLFIKKNKF